MTKDGIPAPIFKAGDRVVILDKGDMRYYQKTATVLNLSPSTQRKRSRGQWRYRLDVGVFCDENMLTKVEDGQ